MQSPNSVFAHGLGGLRASLPGVERTRAEELVALAHEEICPYSRAVRGNVDVRVGVA